MIKYPWNPGMRYRAGSSGVSFFFSFGNDPTICVALCEHGRNAFDENWWPDR